MNNRKPYTGANPQAPKRRHETTPQNGPPSKKPRTDNITNRQQYQSNYEVSYTPSTTEFPLPNPRPKLPPISPTYAESVFTHPGSTKKGTSSNDANSNYDRLEFLGDAYIEIIASRIIYESYPTTNAGGLAKLRESVVKNETLAKYSIMYGFDKKLTVSDMPKDGVKGWTKIYGDVFEAYAAAIVLSSPSEKDGQDVLERWLRALWAPVLTEVKSRIAERDFNAKDELSRRVVCKGIKLNYVEERKGVIHVGQGKETFYIGVYLDGWGWKNQHLGSGQGSSKVIAGQEAAKMALENRPLIDEVVAKKEEFMRERAEAVKIEET